VACRSRCGKSSVKPRAVRCPVYQTLCTYGGRWSQIESGARGLVLTRESCVPSFLLSSNGAKLNRVCGRRWCAIACVPRLIWQASGRCRGWWCCSLPALVHFNFPMRPRPNAQPALCLGPMRVLASTSTAIENLARRTEDRGGADRILQYMRGTVSLVS
jgi:hypothetical protein